VGETIFVPELNIPILQYSITPMRCVRYDNDDWEKGSHRAVTS